MKRLDELLQRGAGDSQDGTGGWSSAEPELTQASELVGDADCPVCGGAGFVQRGVPFGHPDFGRAVPCRCVLSEPEDERVDRLRRYSSLGSLARQTFATLNPRGRSPNPLHQERFAAALSDARRFAAEPAGWLALVGVSGTGKTHLAAAISIELIERGQPVFFAVVPDLLDHLRVAYGPASELPYDRLFETVRSAAVLVLDSLGTQASTPWAEEKLFQIVNHRFNERLATVITTSSRLEELDERLRTRITDPELTRLHILENGPGHASGFPDALGLPLVQSMTFASFNPDPAPPDISSQDSDSLRGALKFARNYAEKPDGWLTFLGGTGAGKTHLAAAIAHDLVARGWQARFVVVPDLLDNLRSSLYGDDRTRGDVVDAVRSAPFLVLDDLGVHSATAWAQEKLFQILNQRYNARLPTVITVSGKLDDLPAAWASRMYDKRIGMLFEIQAPDRRSLRPRAAASPARRPRPR